MKTILIEVCPKEKEGNFNFDVYLHKAGCNLEETHYEKVGSVPFKFVGNLTSEEIGQELGGN